MEEAAWIRSWVIAPVESLAARCADPTMPAQLPGTNPRVLLFATDGALGPEPVRPSAAGVGTGRSAEGGSPAREGAAGPGVGVSCRDPVVLRAGLQTLYGAAGGFGEAAGGEAGEVLVKRGAGLLRVAELGQAAGLAVKGPLDHGGGAAVPDRTVVKSASASRQRPAVERSSPRTTRSSPPRPRRWNCVRSSSASASLRWDNRSSASTRAACASSANRPLGKRCW